MLKIDKEITELCKSISRDTVFNDAMVLIHRYSPMICFRIFVDMNVQSIHTF